MMRNFNSNPRRMTRFLLGATFLVVLGGCRTGPLAEFAYYNPWIREEWQKDEAIAPTLHKQMEEMRAIHSRAGSMAPAEQEHYARILVDKLNEKENTLLRISVVRTLGQLHTGTAFQALKTALNDESEDVRIIAVGAIAEHPPEHAIPVLAATLAGDIDHDVRIELIRQLGEFDDPMAVRAISTALDDSDPAIQYTAVRSLENSTNANVGNNVPAWREYLQANYGIQNGPDGTKTR